MDIRRELIEQLQRIERDGLLRRLTPIEGRIGPRVRVAGRELVLLCSNDYLGLSGRPELAEAAALAAREHGVGASGSRLISGDLLPLRELEAIARAWVGQEEALVFSSGTLANVGLLSALAGPQDVVLSDELNHASIVDGCRLSGAEKVIFPHLDLDALEDGLRRSHAARRRIVISETLYSMDGDSPELPGLVELCRRHDAGLVLDEAHALGLFGPAGAGLAAACGIGSALLALVGTLGKACGAAGAFVAGPRPLRDYLINTARTQIFSTAISPALAAAATRGIELARRMDAERGRLLAMADNLRGQLRRLGFHVPHGRGPIVPLILGDEAAALRGQQVLWDQGVWVQAIRPPSVPAGTCRLRFSLRADLAPADLALINSAVAELAARL